MVDFVVSLFNEGILKFLNVNNLLLMVYGIINFSSVNRLL
jgi:hypothetical protein